VSLESAADAPAAIRALAPMAEGEVTSRGATVIVPVRSRRGVLVEAVKLLSDAGAGVEDVNVRRPTLDDVFLSLTGHAAEEPAAQAQEEDEAA
jgi:ABC-2 type transport system ATP-binding protein